VAASANVGVYSFPGVLGQLELDRTSSFPLSDDRTADCRSMWGDVFHSDTNQVAPTLLAVDREIEHGNSQILPSTWSLVRMIHACFV
jgi:hypothetical protein